MKVGLIISLVSLIVSIAFVGLLEVALTFILIDPPENYFLQRCVATYYRKFERDIIQFNPLCGQYDPELAYILRPGSCEFSNREFETTVSVNTLGIRDDQGSLVEPDVVVLGDSYSMGWGVNDDETYPSVLERVTGKRVLNIAVPSYGTAREVLMLKRSGAKPQQLVVQYSENDFGENVAFMEGEGKLNIMGAREYFGFARHYAASRQYFTGRYLRDFLPIIVKRALRSGPPKPEARDTALEVKAFIYALNQVDFDTSGTDLVVVELNSWGGTDRKFITVLRAESNQLQRFKSVKVLDLSESLNRDDFFFYDNHLLAKGHVKVAGAVSAVLK